MYFFPRDCPRACFWPGKTTSAQDRELWFGHVAARMVVAIESSSLDRLRSTTLYRYVLPEQGFVLRDEMAGHWVSREAVEPVKVEPLTDLLGALSAADVELRVTPRAGRAVAPRRQNYPRLFGHSLEERAGLARATARRVLTLRHSRRRERFSAGAEPSERGCCRPGRSD
jgi:Family of unknown function (DUF6886)